MADAFQIVNGPGASILSNINDLDFEYLGDSGHSPTYPTTRRGIRDAADTFPHFMGAFTPPL